MEQKLKQIEWTINVLASQLINKRPMTERLRGFVDESLKTLEESIELLKQLNTDKNEL